MSPSTTPSHKRSRRAGLAAVLSVSTLLLLLAYRYLTPDAKVTLTTTALGELPLRPFVEGYAQGLQVFFSVAAQGYALWWLWARGGEETEADTLREGGSEQSAVRVLLALILPLSMSSLVNIALAAPLNAEHHQAWVLGYASVPVGFAALWVSSRLYGTLRRALRSEPTERTVSLGEDKSVV